MVFVKKSGGYRSGVDCQALNAVISTRCHDMLDQLGGKKIFTAHYGYWLIKMCVESKRFSMHDGQYQFRVMPFCVSRFLYKGYRIHVSQQLQYL